MSDYIDAVPIRLRSKYREGIRYKTKTGHSDRTGVKHRKKINEAEKRKLPPQPVKVAVVDGRRGSRRMITVADDTRAALRSAS